MALVRPLVKRGAVTDDRVYPGDLLSSAESLLAGQIPTVGNGTWLAADIATGIIYRSGPTGAYTDTTDTAANIINALMGNDYSVDAVNGTTFRLLFINSVAEAMTFAAGSGVVEGSGVFNTIASNWREYLLTILSAQPPVILQGTTTNGSPTVNFYLPNPGQTGISIGPNQKSTPVYEGALITGTGVPASTTVQGLIMGTSGLTGVTMSANATASGTVALTFLPYIQIDGLRSGSL